MSCGQSRIINTLVYTDCINQIMTYRSGYGRNGNPYTAHEYKSLRSIAICDASQSNFPPHFVPTCKTRCKSTCSPIKWSESKMANQLAQVKSFQPRHNCQTIRSLHSPSASAIRCSKPACRSTERLLLWRKRWKALCGSEENILVPISKASKHKALKVTIRWDADGWCS